MNILFKLKRNWQSSITRWLPYRCVQLANENVPDKLEPRQIYLLGTPAWRIIFICPCGCGDRVDLCLLPDFNPHWKLQADSVGRVTLYPSVWKKSGCCSHYFLRNGRLLWV